MWSPHLATCWRNSGCSMPVPPYFKSRRSVVAAANGMLATTHPLAAVAGLSVLQSGGNAADAAVAAAFTLNVVEPFNNGLGGDMFALVWSAHDKQVHALNGSGPAPAAATITELQRRGIEGRMPETGLMPVTVPGAVGGLSSLLQHHGSLPLPELLRPAIRYADEGFPVPEVMARQWHNGAALLASTPEAAAQYLFGGKAPRAGQIVCLPKLAETLRVLSRDGLDAFYRGPIAESVVNYCEQHNGLITREDLANYEPEWVKPISTEYRGVRIYECPPNGQGIVTLEALNILEGYDLATFGGESADVRHVQIEALRHAFADGLAYVADPACVPVPVEAMLSKEYAASRRDTIDLRRAQPSPLPGTFTGDDTIYLTVVDKDRNAVSLISSLYFSFGSGVVAGDTGILLQNRGACFSLDTAHPNALAPGKRAYQTIIPALATRADELWLSFGLVGGYMQPQGHVQLINNLVDFNMDVQAALDAPRFRLQLDGTVTLESGNDPGIVSELKTRGHMLTPGVAESLTFGGGQIIAIDPESGALLGGSEPRKDGCAIGF